MKENSIAPIDYRKRKKMRLRLKKKHHKDKNVQRLVSHQQGRNTNI